MRIEKNVKLVSEFVLFFVFIAGFCLITMAKDNDKNIKIGIYDSRSIALAYSGTDNFRKRVREIKSNYQNAKENNNKKDMKRYEKIGKNYQKQLHKQVFSTYPVDNILKKYEKQLNAVMRNVEVGLIISKWDKKSLKHYKKAEKVDITEKMILMIKPDEKQYKMAIDIQTKKPISKFTMFFINLMH